MKPTSPPFYQPPPTMSRAQTLLWFLGGIACMFVVVSIAFAIKLAGDGHLPFFKPGRADSLVDEAKAGTRPAKAAADSETVSPPISAAIVTGGASRSFVSGSENLLPPEAANLSKVADPDANAPPPAPPVTAPALVPPTASAAASAPGSAPVAVGDNIEATLQKWAEAWTHKDVDRYLRHYAADFQPASGFSHELWMTQRRQRLARPEEISVSLSELEVMSNGGKAIAHFTQTYRAGPQTLREAKTLELVLRDGEWLIAQERLGR